LTYKNAQPVTVIIAGVEHTRGIQFWFVATRLLSFIVHPAFLVLAVQRYIARGLTFGAIKGRSVLTAGRSVRYIDHLGLHFAGPKYGNDQPES
jgi:hypothetical protein